MGTLLDHKNTKSIPMKISVNGVKLYFDVEGAGLRPEGSIMTEKPTLLLLHGGPGADHSLYKPYFSKLTDIAQVVYLDHRGNGRSDPASESTWNLAQWAHTAMRATAAASAPASPGKRATISKGGVLQANALSALGLGRNPL